MSTEDEYVDDDSLYPQLELELIPYDEPEEVELDEPEPEPGTESS
jgi:hypothetical protein